jgi:hypothetical protein
MSIIGSIGEAFGFLPWQAEDAVSGALGTAGQLAGAVGNVAGLFSGGGNDVGTGKIYTRPMEENIADMEKLRAYLAKNRQSIQIPTRRLTADEMADTTFAPQGVMALQRAMDERGAANRLSQSTQAASPDKMYETSADYLSAAQGANSGGYKYTPVDINRIMEAAGQPNYTDYTRDDVIRATNSLASRDSTTKAADSQFLVEKLNRIHEQFDPKPKKKKGGLGGLIKTLLPAAVGLGVGTLIPGIGGAIAGKVASGVTSKATGER